MNRKKEHTSALNEREGISDSEITNDNAIHKLKKKRHEQPSIKLIIEGILKGDITALSRAITFVESKNN